MSVRLCEKGEELYKSLNHMQSYDLPKMVSMLRAMPPLATLEPEGNLADCSGPLSEYKSRIQATGGTLDPPLGVHELPLRVRLPPPLALLAGADFHAT